MFANGFETPSPAGANWEFLNGNNIKELLTPWSGTWKEISDNAIEIREFYTHSVLFYLVFVTESYAIALNNAEKIVYIAVKK